MFNNDIDPQDDPDIQGPHCINCINCNNTGIRIGQNSLCGCIRKRLAMLEYLVRGLDLKPDETVPQAVRRLVREVEQLRKPAT